MKKLVCECSPAFLLLLGTTRGRPACRCTTGGPPLAPDRRSLRLRAARSSRRSSPGLCRLGACGRCRLLLVGPPRRLRLSRRLRLPRRFRLPGQGARLRLPRRGPAGPRLRLQAAPRLRLLPSRRGLRLQQMQSSQRGLNTLASGPRSAAIASVPMPKRRSRFGCASGKPRTPSHMDRRGGRMRSAWTTPPT